MSRTRTPEDAERFGFRWGVIDVVRYTDNIPGGGRVVAVESDFGAPVEIYASKTGRSIRVFRSGQELK